MLLRKAQEIATLKEENKALHYDIEDTQQCSRRNSIRISGISESADEKPEDINKKIRDLFTQSLSVVVNDTDLCRLHCTGKSKNDGTPRQILVKCTNYSARRRVLKARNKSQSKLDDLKHMADENLIDIITISETWLSSEINDNVLYIPGYQQILRQDRIGRAGGVAIYIRDGIGFTHRLDLEDGNQFDAMCL